MVVHVEYNEAGHIRSVACVATAEFADGSKGRVGRRPSPGHSILEIVTADVRHERDVDGLRKVKENYRVAGHPHQPRLVGK
jgi:hypothetical protein